MHYGYSCIILFVTVWVNAWVGISSHMYINYCQTFTENYWSIYTLTKNVLFHNIINIWCNNILFFICKWCGMSIRTQLHSILFTMLKSNTRQLIIDRSKERQQWLLGISLRKKEIFVQIMTCINNLAILLHAWSISMKYHMPEYLNGEPYFWEWVRERVKVKYFVVYLVTICTFYFTLNSF